MTAQVSCASASPNKPYCLETTAGQATCVAKNESPLLTNCPGSVASNFVCKQEGIVPDPIDCTR